MFFRSCKNRKPKVWCKPICVNTSFLFLVDFELVASSMVSFLISLSEINVVCIGFCGLPTSLLEGGSVVSFS